MIRQFWSACCLTILLISCPVFAEETGASSLGPLENNPPDTVAPEFLGKALGAAIGGLPWPLMERVEHATGEDRWLVELGTGWQRKTICLMKLDRATGESAMERRIEAGGNWCYVPKNNLLFAGRFAPKKGVTTPGGVAMYEKPKLIYECFDLTTNQSLWTMPSDNLILWSSLSHDGNEVIILQCPPSATYSYEGSAFLSWHDSKTGKVLRKVAIPGSTRSQEDLCERSSIVDTPDFTYICRRSKTDPPCMKIARGSESAEPLFGDGAESGADMMQVDPDVSWAVTCSDNFKWIAFYTSQVLHVFKRDQGRLVELKEVSAGGEGTIGDDVSSVRFIPKSSRLIVGSMRKTAILDLAARKMEERIFDGGGKLSDVTSDGTQMVMWDSGGSWPVDMKDGKWTRNSLSRDFVKHYCPLQDLAFSASGRYLVSNDYGHFIVWDVVSGKALAGLATSKKNESSPDFRGLSSPVVAEKQGKVYGGDGLRALEWSLADIERSAGTAVLEGTPAFGSIGRLESVYNMDLAIDESGERIIDADANEVRFRLYSNPGASRKLKVSEDDLYRPRQFFFPPDKDKLLIFGLNRASQIDLTGKNPPLDLQKSVFAITPSGMAYDNAGMNPQNPTVRRYGIGNDSSEKDEMKVVGAPWQFAWGMTDATDDNRLFIYAGNSEEVDKICVMNWEKKELVRTFKSPAKIEFLKVSPDGKFVAVAGHDRRVYLWDLGGL